MAGSHWAGELLYIELHATAQATSCNILGIIHQVFTRLNYAGTRANVRTSIERLGAAPSGV